MSKSSESPNSLGFDLRDRITEVLRLHQWRATVRYTDDDPVLDCTCGMAFGQHHTFDCYREHVADAVIRELRPERVLRTLRTQPKGQPMTDNLRDRIAAAIYNACDDHTRKLLVRPDCPGASELEGDGKPVCYTLADAVIAELGPLVRYWDKDFRELHYCRECGGWGPMDD